ncbi:MAG: PIG-L family deacetylase [Proteobacteria bacterium]|nr:PIG-L family deacetylase [Pseudomonadota bacterium]
MLDERLKGRLVVVSPHLDDAVLSLGATLAHAVESGSDVQILTVFACAPDSNAPTDEWDRKSGFATEGEAAQQRRREDETACAILGVAPRWFDFGAEPYERHGSMQEVVTAVASATADADIVLMPGFPLAHADHAALTNGLLSHGLSCRRVGLYAEQPYSFDRSATPNGSVPDMPAARIRSGTLTWQRACAAHRHRQLKLRAVKQYVSQLPQLGLRQLGHLRLRRMLWQEARLGGETIAWPNAT